MMGSNREASHDILDDVDIIVQCNLCSASYPVRASLIRESQRMLAEGCTGSSAYECTASYLATLVDPDDLDELARAWRRFEERVTCRGGVGVTVRADAPSQARRHLDADVLALERGENEGGRCVGQVGAGGTCSSGASSRSIDVIVARRRPAPSRSKVARARLHHSQSM